VIYFLDTSALAKRYLTEKGSSRIRRLLEGKADVFYQTFIAPLEFASALYRRLRAGELKGAEVTTLLRSYVAHAHQDYLLVPYSDALMARAATLVARHALRTLDSIQLASALELRDILPLEELPVCFMAADDRLLTAAREEHLQTLNPEKW
jgi:uncharacterized protein